MPKSKITKSEIESLESLLDKIEKAEGWKYPGKKLSFRFKYYRNGLRYCDLMIDSAIVTTVPVKDLRKEF